MHSSTNPIAQSALANFGQFQWSQGVQRLGDQERSGVGGVGGDGGKASASLGDLPMLPEGLRPAPIVGRKHKSHHPSSSSESSQSPHNSPRDSPRHYSQHGSSDDDYGSHYGSQHGSQHGSSCDEGDEAGPKRRKPSKTQWTDEEDLFILSSLKTLGTQWPLIARQMQNRSADGVRNRWHRLQATHGLGLGGEGDAALDSLLASKGWSAPMLPVTHEEGDDEVGGAGGAAGGAPERKTGIAHGRSMWSDEEDRLIEEGVRRHGCKWRAIAAALPGRSDSSVRNRWMRIQKERDMLRITPHTSGSADNTDEHHSGGVPMNASFGMAGADARAVAVRTRRPRRDGHGDGGGGGGVVGGGVAWAAHAAPQRPWHDGRGALDGARWRSRRWRCWWGWGRLGGRGRRHAAAERGRRGRRRWCRCAARGARRQQTEGQGAG